MGQDRETTTPPLELWGGVECTVVRLGDEYRDQLVETGHAMRLADLDAIAELGIKTVRYPIVWERVAAERPDELDFAWHDERLRKLRDLGVRVIGGLVHHGSGPRYTSLLDPDFPAKLGEYAARVAERYPWIDMWTPVNEPLTTARFACLYGH
jgi:dTDP-4-dehydrorhamnose reductase